MANQGRVSTIATHAARVEIERALDNGEPYRSISAKYGVSRSALSRFALSRKPMERIVNGEPNLTTIVPRLVEAADDAQALRRQTRLSGNAAARARAIKVESDILATLADRLGLDDLTLTEFYDQTAELIRSLGEFAKRDPEAARSFIETLKGHPALSDLTDALKRLIHMETNPDDH